MKKPVVDYRKFRLSKLKTPEYSHLLLLLSWVAYFLGYFLTENLIPEERCFPVHCALDDMIPFCEWFVIPYVFWYFLIAGSLLYFALYNVENFKNLMKFIIITQILALGIYVIFPNRQDLRPAEFPRENALTWVVGLLYSVDTSTNVCPSLHVAYSIGIASTWLKEKGASLGAKIFVVAAAVLICLATTFIKQHSVVDFFVALPVCLYAEVMVFGKSYYAKKLPKAKVK